MSSNTIILDCSSISSTFDAFEQAFQKPKDRIVADLRKMQSVIEQYSYSPDETLYFHFFTAKEQFNIFYKIAFFHLTRTNDPTNFKINGLLPTNLAILQIWNIIKCLVEESKFEVDLYQLRTRLENDTQSMYYHKLYVDSDGPYAFLTQETAFNRSCCNHFLDCPEIIDDILQVIDEKAGISLYEQYREITDPYIVKFYAMPSDSDSPWKYIGAALEYIYWHSVNEGTGGSDIGFDGNGTPIPPEQIVKITKI
ncbi:MAG: hypothetical protein PF482_06565 [Desulfobacteraceae bacterium]|jgi:hypothetical protein|nr:hypothetical protein [Desulfobacteraceae bacterium]